ncbi:MAG: ThuA domain-containing protein [Flavobacteriales bacterium]|nr:ThuA domain-containing protein [Flavobacteriales bacterium]
MRWTPLLFMLSTAALSAQPRVLHFTRTSGFDHGTREVSFAMFQDIAFGLGVEVDDDATGETFSEGSALAEYTVIVFSNTSGNALLDAQQQANFEEWVANGGRVLGIHAATDTYRHSTANGGNTGSWDFYAELMGASVQESPNHVNGTPEYDMEHIGTHTSTANLPDPWVKNEEYYYWEGGYYAPDNTEVLRVEETVGPNGEVNSYDAPRPMSWYRELPNGSRVFYTALGHATENYTDDALFRTHVGNGLAWLLDAAGTGMMNVLSTLLSITQTRDAMQVLNAERGSTLVLFDMSGRVVRSERVQQGSAMMRTDDLQDGRYILRVGERAQPVVILH